MQTSIQSKKIFLSIAMLLLSLAWAVQAAETASESVLASGRWVKIKVKSTGMYQLTRSTLSSWGFKDISKVKIFGYGGAMISERLDDSYVDDLPQVAAYRSDSKLVFFAQGPERWDRLTSGGVRYKQVQNLYATEGYYFLTDRDDIPVKEMATTGTTGGADKLITTFPDRVAHEVDTYSPGITGNMFIGEDLRNGAQFSFSLPGRVEETAVSMAASVASNVQNAVSTFTFSANGRPLSGRITTSGTTNKYKFASTGTTTNSFTPSGEKVDIDVDFSTSGSATMARLDYITLNYTRQLSMDGSSLFFRNYSDAATDSTFSIRGAVDETLVWDITRGYAPAAVQTAKANGVASFRQTESGIREYVAFNPSATFPAPGNAGVVGNQNLHGQETPTMLIITPAAFLSQAERVAELHRSNDGMKVVVATDAQVYNEFSSGTPDAMAYRKISKMWWDRTKTLADNSNDKYRYLLLFGRSLYDNRRVTPNGRALTYPTLLTWESYNSTDEDISYNSDDPFAYLEDGSNATDPQALLNIAVGRMPVKTLEEATTVVDKLYSYVENKDMGPWRNRVMIIADDAANGSFMEQSNETVDALKANGGENYVYNHVYIDAFNKIGGKYPDARTKMYDGLKEGVIYASYLGHAAPTTWTGEGLLLLPDLENNFYYKHYPVMFTGTCEFTRWDSPSVSGGEMLYLNGRGGVIAMFTSARTTGIATNGNVARSLSDYMFRPEADGSMPRLGDVMKNSKNAMLNFTYSGGGKANVKDVNQMKYMLIGDPAMRAAYPANRVVVDKINGQPCTDGSTFPEVAARQEVTVSGYLTDASGTRLNGFNGLLNTTVYDSEMSVTTHGNSSSDEEGVEVTYQERSNRLYVGTDSVKNGEFSLKFRVPTEINNNYTPAQISLYAYTDDKKEDANGSMENFYVYGYSDEDDEDRDGPEISLMALNTSAFKDGDRVNESPYFMANMTDASGINLSSVGVGHGMTLLLDEKTTISGIENSYTQNSDKEGQVYYQLNDLSNGEHTLRLRVWDIFGNPSEKTISFVVERGLKPEVVRVYSDANPAKTEANFYIEHNRPDAMVNVTVTVYNMMGQEVWTKTEHGRSDMFTTTPLSWDLTDGTGRRVGRGIYIYRASIATDGGEEASKAQRIAVAAE